MINYKDTPVEISNTNGSLDIAIRVLQDKLTKNLDWLEKVYGLAVRQVQKVVQNKQTKTNIIPEGYVSRAPFSLMPNDNLKSYCFFLASDPGKFSDWQPYTPGVTAVRPVSIIFWMNLQRIDPARSYDFSEELFEQVIRVLKKCPSYRVQEYFTQPDRVFVPFTITETYQGYMKPPYAAFRLDGTLKFTYLNC